MVGNWIESEGWAFSRGYVIRKDGTFRFREIEWNGVDETTEGTWSLIREGDAVSLRMEATKDLPHSSKTGVIVNAPGLRTGIPKSFFALLGQLYFFFSISTPTQSQQLSSPTQQRTLGTICD